jgi:acetoacetate decarboxylase
LDPARYQYREFMILVNAVWNETKVAWCPYIFVDNDAALARGWIRGFPKKMGSIAQTRTIGAPSPAAPVVGPGSRFAASASAAGRRLAEAEVALEKPLGDTSALFRPIVNLRYFPRLAAGKHQEPAVNELVMSVLEDLKINNAWAGKGRLTLPAARGEEVADLVPDRIGVGFRASLSYTVKDLRVLADLRHG